MWRYFGLLFLISILPNEASAACALGTCITVRPPTINNGSNGRAPTSQGQSETRSESEATPAWKVKARGYLDEGNRAYDEGDYARALNYYAVGLKVCQESELRQSLLANWYTASAILYADGGSFDLAEQELVKAIEQEPEPDYWFTYIFGGAELAKQRKTYLLEIQKLREQNSAAVAEQSRKREALETALFNTARTPHCTDKLACNYFVARAAQLLHVSYLQDGMYPGKEANDIGGEDEWHTANQIYEFMFEAVNSGASGWKLVDGATAQQRADNGRLVIGVAQSVDTDDPDAHGHIVIVAPMELRRRHVVGHSGPWVRDAQNPEVSVQASSRFGGDVTKPIYAVWLPNTY